MNYKLSNITFHSGASDGSAGIACGPGHFIAATDEENTLRLFSTAGGEAVSVLKNLNEWEPLPKKLGDDGVTYREADIEGATRIEDIIYWISSHARDKHGKSCPERQILFATRCIGEGSAAMLETAGRPYTRLLEDLRSASGLKFLQPFMDAEIPPKQQHGFNIESLCASDGLLYIGFRNPIIDGKALMLPLANPAAVIQTDARVVFGEPIFLELGGLGFRDMVKWRGGFLIVAGDYRDRFTDKDAEAPKLFFWSGKTDDEYPQDLNVDLLDLNPESALLFGGENGGRVLLLSDDGKRDQPAGKKRKGISTRRFRSAWLESDHPL